MIKKLKDFLLKNVAGKREPDFLIGAKDKPYLRRWWVIPRNKIFNIYLHQFLHSDDDRALHDHPWLNLSICLSGRLTEIYLNKTGKTDFRNINAGDCVARRPKAAHRLIVAPEDVGITWTLFITGPVVRKWGFLCPQGWVYWVDFVRPGAKGEVGRGCGEL